MTPKGAWPRSRVVLLNNGTDTRVPQNVFLVPTNFVFMRFFFLDVWADAPHELATLNFLTLEDMCVLLYYVLIN